MTDQPEFPTSDERVMAALSHLLGFLVALIFWAFQRDKSRFVRFQSLQAMAFDLLVSAISILVIGGIITLAFGVVAVGIGDLAIFGSQNNPVVEPFGVLLAMMTALPFWIACIAIPLAGVIFVARLIATVQTFQGMDFRYPWLGNVIERSLDH
ncbi:MAG: DUF4870 domain-containing protein [Acidobacteriaceae bacterium]